MATTMVVATIRAGGSEGLGWTYAGACCKAVVEDELNGVLYGGDPMDIPGLWGGMVRACRNLGPPGWATQTGGSYSAMEIVSPQLSGPRPHTRDQSEEYFLLLDGRVAFIVGEEHYDVESGGFVHVPRGIVHEYQSPRPGSCARSSPPTNHRPHPRSNALATIDRHVHNRINHARLPEAARKLKTNA